MQSKNVVKLYNFKYNFNFKIYERQSEKFHSNENMEEKYGDTGKIIFKNMVQ